MAQIPAALDLRRLTGEPPRDLALWVLLRALLDAAGHVQPITTAADAPAVSADAVRFLADSEALSAWADAAGLDVDTIIAAAQSRRMEALLAA